MKKYVVNFEMYVETENKEEAQEKALGILSGVVDGSFICDIDELANDVDVEKIIV